MEISEFARTVLCSPHLEDKLVQPAGFTDLRPDQVGRIPDRPARPKGLGFAPAEDRTPFPNALSLADETKRAVALHFFANHELLALELMALALLRFPDADPGFRHGIARIMLDEQTHFRLYRDRSAELGVGFGEHGLNSFFWDALSGMSTPVEYVTQLAMTFEQANLDYAAFYRDLFEEFGDGSSRDVLDTVHEDEVRHLAFGLHWFERWRDPSQDLWEAWTDALPAPLGPAWGRGIDLVGFSAGARRRAGLPDRFIRQVRTCSHSKGRPSCVLLFNPEPGELGEDVASGPAADELRADLAPAFGVLGGREDLLVGRPLGLERLEQLQGAGLRLPQMVDAVDLPQVLAGRRHLDGVRPWRWDADARALDEELRPRLLGPSPPEAGLLGELGGAAFARALVADLGAAEPAPDPPRELSVSLQVHTERPERSPAVVRLTDTPLGDAFVVGAPWGGLSKGLRRWLNEPGAVGPAPAVGMRRAADRARARLAEAGYVGPASLEFQVCGGPEQGWTWQLVRLVPHRTWGQATARLGRLLRPGRAALWLHADLDAVRRAGLDGFEALEAEQRASMPLQIVRTGGSRRLDGGALATTDPSCCRRRFTVLLVGSGVDDLLARLPRG